jgi:hypothetical protein
MLSLPDTNAAPAGPVPAWRDGGAVPPGAADPVAQVGAALAASELLQAVAGVRRDGGRSLALGEAPVRALSPEEVAGLERQGNSCPDWSRVRVADGFDWRAVRGSRFHGDVLLGRFGRPVRVAEGVSLPSGVVNSTVVDGVVGHDALVQDVRLLANYVVGPEALVFDCGTVSCGDATAFGNGAVLPVGPETGGRDVAVYAEIGLDGATAVARSPARQGLPDRYGAAVAEYAARARSARGVVGRGAALRGTPRVENAFVGPHARVDGATLLADSTLLSGRDEPAQVLTGACVSRSLLQWGSRVATLAVVERSVLLEHAHAERHAKVTNSIIACNSGVEAGEVTSSLVGPFVNFHHQALLISALWPEGKGNVSYGANVGSNHTGRAPDQEFLPGEGTFLGLGVNVKYPSDFSRAPYSIIACGVTTLPQKLALPFSLVSLPAARFPDVSPAYNQIIPAWLLTDNLYALRRNEGKYRSRNRARRTPLEFEVFRPHTIDLMRDACRRLAAVGRVKEVYTERDLDGVGKNYLLEAHRQAALDAYRFFIRSYALLGLLGHLRALPAGGAHRAPGHVLVTPTDAWPWEYQRRLLHDELGCREVVPALRELPGVLETIARAVERAKAKDDERGPGVIPDYAAVHVPAAQDPIVRQAWEEARSARRQVEALIGQLGGGAGSQGPLPGSARQTRPPGERGSRAAG